MSNYSMNPRKAGHLLWDKVCHLSSYFSVFFVIALSVIDISNVNDCTTPIFGVEIGKIIYVVSVVFALLFGILSIFNTHETSLLDEQGKQKDLKIADLENSLNQVIDETNQLFNSYLKLLTKSLGFGHSERISVYKIYNNEFLRIGRTSEDPNLKNSGRKSYPINEGLIGKGWSTGECYIDSLPDPSERNGTSYYNAINAAAAIPRTVVDNMNMKSRTYYICRIEGFDGEPKAIFVAESKNPQAFTKETMLEKIESIRQPLIMFIEKINSPNVTTQQNLNNIGL